MPLPVPSPSRLMRSALPTPSKRQSKTELPPPPPPTTSRSMLPSPPRSTRASVSSRPTSRPTSSRAESRPPSTAADDAVRMPPPPLNRTRSQRSIASIASTNTIRSGTTEKKTSAFGRAGDALRRATGRSRDSLKDSAKASSSPSSSSPKIFSRAMTLRSSTIKERSPKSEGGGVFGLARSMSSRHAKKETPPPPTMAPLTTRDRARPTSMVQPSTRTPNPPAQTLKSHRRIPSTASATSSSKPSERPGTAPKRPAFTTLRQDFTNPAPPPRHKTSMPPPPLDAQTIYAQTQLLQYSCLHATSHETYAALTISARAKLKARFDTLAAQHASTRARLTAVQKPRNLRGLAAVIEAPPGGVGGRRRETIRSADEKIQSFSEAIKKVETMQSNEHAVLTREFGEWVAGYTPADPQGCEEEWVQGREKWIDGLGEGWRRECGLLMRRIEACVHDVQGVVSAVVGGEGDMGVVAVVAERWLEIARGMGEECQGMVVVEERIVEREKKVLDDLAGQAGLVRDEEEREMVGVWAR